MKTTDRLSGVPAFGAALCACLCALSIATVAQAAPGEGEGDKPSRGSPIHSWGAGDSTGGRIPAKKPPKMDVDSRLVPGAKTADPVRKAAWNAANQQAKRRISDFDQAVKSGNADAIRKATLDLQSDPLAVQHLNKSGRGDLIEFHNRQTQAIRDATKQNIKEEMARRWNAENPHDPIKPSDVELFEPTNYRKPGVEPHVGQDWDVTVRVRGKDVPPAKAKGVVEDSFFKAAGGEKTFGKGTTPAEAAHRQSVEVTDSKSLESYKEPDKILGKDGQAPDPKQRLDNPDDVGRVIEHKSNQAANKAAESRKKGNEVDAVRQDYEQMRQAVKQYDKITDPRVKGQGGKVGNQVEKGMEVMREVADLKISPEEGRAKLAEMGETPDSITRKAAGQIEAAQKLKPQTVGEGSKQQTAGENSKAQTADEGGKTSTGSDKAAKPDSAARGDAPESGKTSTGDEGGRTAADADTTAKPDSAARGDAPEGGKAVGVDAPDGGRVAAGDAPKATAPDGPKVASGDAPKATAPDAPGGKMTKAGKVMDTAGKIGDGIDIFAGAKDFSDAAKEGDTEKMAEAAINTADSLTGGTIATGKLIDEQKQTKEQTDREHERVDPQHAVAKRQQMRVDLRKEGYSRDEADKMVDAYAAGDDSGVKEAYGKMGKEMPKAGTAAPETASEAAGIYIEEVKENAADAWEGMKTQAGKAKDFLVETKDNLGEIGGGIVGEEGVAEELASQIKENVSAENFNVAHEAWKTSRDADAKIDEARQDMEDRLVEKGWSRTKAKVEADHRFGRQEKGDTAKELAQQVKENVSSENLKEGYDAWRQNRDSKSREADARKELVEKFVGEGFDRDEAQEAVDDFYGVNDPEGRSDKTKFKEMTRQVRERNLRDAEANGEGGEEDDDDDEGGGLKGFKDRRTAKVDENAESSYGLMGQEQNLAEASTRGDQAEDDAKRAVSAAGADAQSTSGKAAASSAAADREEGWGKAIADGVQQGVEAGATALGSSFGDTAGKHASDAAFGDPDKKKHGGKGGGKGGAGDGGEQVAGGGPGGAAGGPAVKSGGGKGGGSSAKKGKGGGKKTASGNKPPTKSSSSGPTIKCPKCGGTKFGPYEQIYETGTVIGRDRRCLTCGHLGGVIVGGSSAPSAPKPAPTAPAPPPVKMKRVAVHSECGTEMTYKGVYYADGTDMYSCPKCGGTYHNVHRPYPIVFKEVPDTAAP